MHKAFQYRLKPNADQVENLRQIGGGCRWLWNTMLAKNKGRYQTDKKFVFKHEMIVSLPNLKKEHSWLGDLPSQSLQQKCWDLDTAMKRCFKSGFGFPHFKQKDDENDSFRIPQTNGHIKVRRSAIKIPKIGWIKWKRHRPIEGRLLSITVKQEGEHWYVSCLCDLHLRVASHVETGLRFHPKVYAFGDNTKSPISLAVVGSANMTASALCGNGEAVSVLVAQGTQDRQTLGSMWSELWGQGRSLKPNELAEYKLRHEAVAKAQAKIAAQILASRSRLKRAEVLTSDIAQLDPILAQTCWIEGGNITLMGKELEFKAEQALFFGLSPTGEDSPKTFRFRVSDGQTVAMKMKFFTDNRMWRLQLKDGVPEVAIGLRPVDPSTGKLGRSPYVAVFKKTKLKDTLDLSFMKLGTAEFLRLRAQSARTGTLGHTTAREYGWC
jgi:hypothetical protein